MPSEYKAAFDLEAATAHEAIVSRRGDQEAHVEIWRELSERVVAICVVAEDRPGLLSAISAALVGASIDVVGAHAYSHTRPSGDREAVDILWLRRIPGATGLVSPIRSRDIAQVAEAIKRGLRAPSRDSIAPPSADGAPFSESGIRTTPRESREASISSLDRAALRSARIKFDNAKDGATLLTVEAVDRPGLLLAVTQALFRSNVQIISLRATTEGGSAVDRFTIVEPNGAPLAAARRLELQSAILGALDEGSSTAASERTRRYTG